MNTKSLYQKWIDREIENFGTFQTTILQAYVYADNRNKERLQKAFPHWFLTSDELKELSEDTLIIFRTLIPYRLRVPEYLTEECTWSKERNEACIFTSKFANSMIKLFEEENQKDYIYQLEPHDQITESR